MPPAGSVRRSAPGGASRHTPPSRRTPRCRLHSAVDVPLTLNYGNAFPALIPRRRLSAPAPLFACHRAMHPVGTFRCSAHTVGRSTAYKQSADSAVIRAQEPPRYRSTSHPAWHSRQRSTRPVRTSERTQSFSSRTSRHGGRGLSRFVTVNGTAGQTAVPRPMMRARWTSLRAV
jgi:hypothetical protein